MSALIPLQRYSNDSINYLYIARDHTVSGRQVVKFGRTSGKPKKRLSSIRAEFAKQTGRLGYRLCDPNPITEFYGDRWDWVIERVWSLNSGRATEEAEKLSVALALGYSGTLPFGQDYVMNLTIEEADRAVEKAIKRVKRSARSNRFELRCKSSRRRQETRAEAGHGWEDAPKISR